MSIPFIQYLMPNGRQIPNSVTRPPEIEALAVELTKAGYRFEIETLRTGEISMECCKNDGEDSLAMEIAPNGPPLLDAVDKLVKDAHTAFTQLSVTP